MNSEKKDIEYTYTASQETDYSWRLIHEVEFEYEFVVDHEDYCGSISCTKTVETDQDIDDPDIFRKLYEENAKIAIEDFQTKWAIIRQGE